MRHWQAAVQISSSQNVHVTGVSISSHQIELAQALAVAKAKDTSSNPQVTLQRAYTMSLPFAYGSFDGAYTIESLFHMNDRGLALSEIHRALHRGTRLAIADALTSEAGGPPTEPKKEIMGFLQNTWQMPSVAPTEREWRDLLAGAGFDIKEFREVRDTLRRSFEAIEAALKKVDVSGDAEAEARLQAVVADVKKVATLRQASCVLITAVRA
ncbi:S-adenosyl-L-methionine-dependent methyltransferase [Aspergillus filifer]